MGLCQRLIIYIFLVRKVLASYFASTDVESVKSYLTRRVNHPELLWYPPKEGSTRVKNLDYLAVVAQ